MKAVLKPPPKRVCLYYNAGLAKTVGNTVAARSYSGPVLGETDKYHGDLKDQDRIFTNSCVLRVPQSACGVPSGACGCKNFVLVQLECKVDTQP